MPITLDLPPAIILKARAFAESRNTTLERLISDCLVAELHREIKLESNSPFAAFSGILSDAEADEIRSNLKQFDAIDSEGDANT